MAESSTKHVLGGAIDVMYGGSSVNEETENLYRPKRKKVFVVTLSLKLAYVLLSATASALLLVLNIISATSFVKLSLYFSASDFLKFSAGK